VIKAEQDLPGTEGGRQEKVGEEGGGRNDPNNVCTCEQKNNNFFKILLVSHYNSEFNTHNFL
jgi:hypothetical protein